MDCDTVYAACPDSTRLANEVSRWALKYVVGAQVVTKGDTGGLDGGSGGRSSEDDGGGGDGALYARTVKVEVGAAWI